jgi:thiamine biosynthesis protein ThiI
MEYDTLLVRYGETGVKSPSVRVRYEKVLVRNISRALEGEGFSAEIEREWGRILVKTSERRAADAVSRVFGVVSSSPAISCEPLLDEICRVAGEVAGKILKKNKTFAVRARKAGSHPFSSMEVASAVGEKISRATSARVDLSSPEEEIHVEVRQDKAYIFTKIVKGVGGLPYGTQGKVIALISGRDSLVAAWMMMKRGCEIVPIHLDTRFCSTTHEKMSRCIAELGKWSPKGFKLYEVPHEKSLEVIGKKMRCILCKRLMYKIAYKIAEIEDAKGVVDGTSLNQASLDILAETGIGFPVFHPLIGMDKMEVVELAKKIGTYDYDFSICEGCKAGHPVARVKIREVEDREKEIGLDNLAEKAVRESRILRV